MRAGANGSGAARGRDARPGRYCTVACQKIDWRKRGHRQRCKAIRDERAAEAARAEAPPSPPKEIFYGPAPRSHADEVRARIAADHVAARARREANPEPAPLAHYGARSGSCCPICLEEWDVNGEPNFLSCCARIICMSCTEKTGSSCPLCRTPRIKSDAQTLAELRRHVENDIPEAIHTLGEAYYRGSLGLKRSAKKAFKIFQRSVELGDVRSMDTLARMYAVGDGVKCNTRKAVQLFRTASDGGFPPAQHNFAVHLAKDGNFTEAGRYYKLAAEQGLAHAEYMMGIYCWRGRGMDLDLEEAKRWLTSAAARGYQEATGALDDMAQEER